MDKKKMGMLLLERVPEYQIIIDEDSFEIGSYLFFNEFASNLGLGVGENITSNFVINSFKFINDLGESDNSENLNLLKVGILEILYTAGIENRNNVVSLLSDKNKELFQSFSELYR